MDRQTRFLWMRDLLAHITTCYDHWQEADPSTDQFLAETIKRDLDDFRQLCDEIAEETSSEHAELLQASGSQG